MIKNISNFDILIDLQLLINNNSICKQDLHSINSYQNVLNIIKIRNEIKKNNLPIFKNINNYYELYSCLLKFNNDIIEIDNEFNDFYHFSINYYFIATPIYHILLSDDELNQMIH